MPDYSRPILAITINTTGLHPQSFRQVTDREAYLKLDHYLEIARWAHKGTLDSLWIPDLPMAEAPATQSQVCSLDPSLLLTALGAHVPGIGIVPTISTSYSEPFNVARQIATLNTLFDGRAGLNAVTSYNPRIAQNFGEAIVPDYEERHQKADEFIEVLRQLGDSWRHSRDGSFDAANALFNPLDRSPINFDGRYFKVRGPMMVPQSRYGRFLLSVAGGSEHSYQLAATRADVIYTAAVNKEAAIEVYEDLKRRTIAAGRRRNALKVMPGLSVVIGSTEEEALNKLNRMASQGGNSADPVDVISGLLGIDPNALHPDRELTHEQMALPENWSRPIAFFHSITDVARRERLTVRQLAQRFLIDVGHGVVVGTPRTVANHIIDWWRSGAVDGFIFRAQQLPEDAQLIAEEVIPILQREVGFPDHYKQESLLARFGNNV